MVGFRNGDSRHSGAGKIGWQAVEKRVNELDNQLLRRSTAATRKQACLGAAATFSTGGPIRGSVWACRQKIVRHAGGRVAPPGLAVVVGNISLPHQGPRGMGPLHLRQSVQRHCASDRASG